MKSIIKNIKIKNSKVYVFFESITDKDMYDIDDSFTEGTLFNILRFKFGIVHTIKYNKDKNLLQINTTSRYADQVSEVVRNFFK